jgi:hypothetical protein
MILKIFSPKNLAKKLAFFSKAMLWSIFCRIQKRFESKTTIICRFFDQNIFKIIALVPKPVPSKYVCKNCFQVSQHSVHRDDQQKWHLLHQVCTHACQFEAMALKATLFCLAVIFSITFYVGTPLKCFCYNKHLEMLCKP